MSIQTKLRCLLNIIHHHPRLAQGYLRNRARELMLGFERRNPDGRSRLPRGVTFKPTLSCNLRCQMCRFASSGDVTTNPKDSLPLEVWTKVVDEVSTFQPYITLTGGEPLLYPFIGGLIVHIKSRGLLCTMTTNGTLLTRRAPEFFPTPPDVLVVSIDGPQELHDEIRGLPGSYQRTLDGIALVQELKRKHGIQQPFLVINSSFTSLNYRHSEKMVEFARELGVDVLNYQHQWSLTDKMICEHNRRYGDVHHVATCETGSIELPTADANEVVQVVQRIRQLTQSKNGSTHVTFHPDLNDKRVYDWHSDPHIWVQRRPTACAWINTEIHPNGDVEPCPGVVCGNITQDTFADIWNSPAFRAHRQRLQTHGDFPICIRCCAYFRRD